MHGLQPVFGRLSGRELHHDGRRDERQTVRVVERPHREGHLARAGRTRRLACIEFVDDFDACTGERVSMTGVQTVIGRVQQDGQGRWHFGFTRNTHGTGTGASGARYLLDDAVARSSFEITPGTPKTYTEQY